jgi:hypothetical protein
LDTATFRRTLASICLITQPLLNLISVAISPRQSIDAPEQLAMIGAHPTRFLIANLLDVLWLVLQVVESGLKQGQLFTAFGQASLGSVAVMLMSAIGLIVGYALLAVGLWRTRAAPRGASALIVAFLVVDIVGLAAGGNKGVLLVAHTLLLVGLGWIGVRILAMSDAQWRGERGTQDRS